jgi:hypothetical protein
VPRRLEQRLEQTEPREDAMQQAAIRITEDELQLELLDEVPSTWSGPHVGRRLSEAMRTLALLPMGNGGGHAAWPPYAYTFEDLLAQHEQGELERTQALQNRIRLLPSSREVQRMETAICWPALAHSLDRDAGWIAAKRGGYADTWRERHDQGCDIIARGLRCFRVPVF